MKRRAALRALAALGAVAAWPARSHALPVTEPLAVSSGTLLCYRAFPSRHALPREIDEEPGSRIAFTDASGAEFAGTLIEADETHTVFDFNHPLAGRTIVFDAQIVGIL